MIKTPDFWYKNKGLISTALLPAAWLYQIGNAVSQSIPNKPYNASIPVLCVGNAIAGGGGKTPTVIALINALKEDGTYKNPYILTRGYGRKSDEALLVDVTAHGTKDVGDEPLLLAKYAPTIVSSNRADGAKLAESHNADIIIMDDGLFHRSLHKDLNIMVVDRQTDFGNNRTLPAGPLREPLSKILPKIDCVLTIGRPFEASDCPVFETVLHADKKPETNKDYVAFAGLAIPDKFKNTLLDLGYKLSGWHPFPDHHPYSQKELEMLEKKAESATLITTEKDYVRLPVAFQNKIETLPVTLQIKKPDALLNFIQEQLKKP